MVLAEMIVLARQIGDRSTECHKKSWFKNSNGCFEVRGKTVGIVGYGEDLLACCFPPDLVLFQGTWALSCLC